MAQPTTERAKSPEQGATNGHAQKIKSFAPATGELLGEVAIQSVAEVREAVARARRAGATWSQLPARERGRRVLAFRDALVDRTDEVVELLSRECGKPKQEALLHEVLVSADLTTYYGNNAERLLAPRQLDLHLMKHRTSTLHYVARGVVAVISPWNFPLYLPLRDIVTAVIAGNGVVLKPSEVTPLIGLKIKEVWDASGLPEDLLQVVTGLGPTGAALIDAQPNFVVFTGSVSTGRRIAAACGERLIPCVLELGGKAPLIACSDADVEKTAKAIVFGGFANAGQVCISVERVYAHREVHDRILDKVVELTKTLRVGDPAAGDVDVGAITFPHQLDVAEKHVADAVAKGATVRTGGKRAAAGPQFFEPTVIANCTHDMTVMTDEIFGPIVPFMQVATEEEALRLANESHLGLNAYVFSRDKAHGERLAERIEAGSVLVNDVLTNGGIPEAPFGGIKQSGFGRALGEDALREMCEVRHVNGERIALPDNPLGFPYSDKAYQRFKKGIEAMFGGGGVLKKLKKLF